MAIHREDYGGTMCLECDECGELQGDIYTRNQFSEMIVDGKKDGWAIVEEKGDWRHICPICIDKSIGIT